jgi:predicted transposase/invertase (TIGR01784 family)
MKSYTHVRFDWAAKKLLRSKANFGILEGFLTELLKEEIKIIDILESEGNQEVQDDKFNRVDILVKDSHEKLIIVEIQNTRELDYLYKILYNSAKAIVEHLKLGAEYNQIKKIITVSVVYFDFCLGDDYVYYGGTSFFGIHRHDKLELSESQKKLFQQEAISDIYPEHYIIKVNEFDDIAKDTLDEWVYFLKNSEIKDEFNAKGMAEAREKLKEINLSKEELPAYRRFQENLSLEASIAQTIRFEMEFEKEQAHLAGHKEGLEEGKKEGLEEGKKEGLEEGKKEERYQIARRLKMEGLDATLIAKASGLLMEEIEKL